jgi:hypothetical protein
MIAVSVTFRLPASVALEDMKRISLGTAEKYRKVPGLIRKYYVRSEDGATAGGIYLWKSRAAAEALYTDDWRKTVQAAYGCAPSITYFDCPVVVDNLSGQIVDQA